MQGLGVWGLSFKVLGSGLLGLGFRFFFLGGGGVLGLRFRVKGLEV